MRFVFLFSGVCAAWGCLHTKRHFHTKLLLFTDTRKSLLMRETSPTLQLSANQASIKFLLTQNILLRSESPNGMCAKLHIVGHKQKQRSRATLTLRVRSSSCSIVHKLISAELSRHDHSVIACSCYIYMVLFARIPFVVNRAFSATPAERLQQYQSYKDHQRHSGEKAYA